MSNDDPLDNLKKGFGFLARAAKSAVEKLPTKDFEDVVTSGVREVGRALGNVKDTIEEEFFDKKAAPPEGTPATPSEAPAAPAKGAGDASAGGSVSSGDSDDGAGI
jgi:hypothetical protein